MPNDSIAGKEEKEEMTKSSYSIPKSLNKRLEHAATDLEMDKGDIIKFGILKALTYLTTESWVSAEIAARIVKLRKSLPATTRFKDTFQSRSELHDEMAEMFVVDELRKKHLEKLIKLDGDWPNLVKEREKAAKEKTSE